jgi:hypothetical protein
MSNTPIKRDHALAVLRPNPMWILSREDQEVLSNSLLPNNGLFLYGGIDCWDAHIENGINNIRVLSTFQRENPKMALLTLHRETTLDDFSFIDIDGNSPLYSKSEYGRQYFDGYTLDKQKLGHVAVACVDFDASKIWTQDSQGIPVKPLIRKAFEQYFPDFEFIDLQIKQQWDAHSCSLITMSNLECFSKGKIPSGLVDVGALRSRYTQILDENDRKNGTPVRPNRYYEAPITELRYTPV